MVQYKKMIQYKLIDHTADFGIQVTAENKKTLFVNAALAMFDLIADTDKNRETQTLFLDISGDDWPDLMVNWLREMLYLWNGEEKLITAVTIENLTGYEIKACVLWYPFDPDKDKIKNEIKAVTYHQIAVTQRSHDWNSRIIFDI
ncbi:conserved uncharacterized protein, DUF101 [Desulfobacula toluolica Tol2]|uniref:Conserved uncharacterized protein, DUF101 n=2 Tax=Desulfobacula toluolica TaxID=28223 RepID=K0NSA8_DESTT|nr:conserved uncharacterized protein, DUF101 [Desulfobacula toluolica Tol2]